MERALRLFFFQTLMDLAKIVIQLTMILSYTVFQMTRLPFIVLESKSWIAK